MYKADKLSSQHSDIQHQSTHLQGTNNKDSSQNVAGINKQNSQSSDLAVPGNKADLPSDVDNIHAASGDIDDKAISNDNPTDDIHLDADDTVDDNQDTIIDSNFDFDPQDIDTATADFMADDKPQKIDETPKENKPLDEPPKNNLPHSTPKDVSAANCVKLEKQVIELKDIVDLQREYTNSLNPFRVLGFYQEVDLKYYDLGDKSKPNYDNPITAAKKYMNYCDYADLYNLFNPSNIYDHMYFMTDHDSGNLFSERMANNMYIYYYFFSIIGEKSSDCKTWRGYSA